MLFPFKSPTIKPDPNRGDRKFTQTVVGQQLKLLRKTALFFPMSDGYFKLPACPLGRVAVLLQKGQQRVSMVALHLYHAVFDCSARAAGSFELFAELL